MMTIDVKPVVDAFKSNGGKVFTIYDCTYINIENGIMKINDNIAYNFYEHKSLMFRTGKKNNDKFISDLVDEISKVLDSKEDEHVA